MLGSQLAAEYTHIVFFQILMHHLGNGRWIVIVIFIDSLVVAGIDRLIMMMGISVMIAHNQTRLLAWSRSKRSNYERSTISHWGMQ